MMMMMMICEGEEAVTAAVADRSWLDDTTTRRIRAHRTQSTGRDSSVTIPLAGEAANEPRYRRATPPPPPLKKTTPNRYPSSLHRSSTEDEGESGRWNGPTTTSDVTNHSDWKKLPSRAHADRRRQHQQVRVAGSTAVHRIQSGAKIRHRARLEIRLHWTVMRLFYRFLLGGPHY